jgi:hypothetical protein
LNNFCKEKENSSDLSLTPSTVPRIALFLSSIFPILFSTIAKIFLILKKHHPFLEIFASIT